TSGTVEMAWGTAELAGGSVETPWRALETAGRACGVPHFRLRSPRGRLRSARRSGRLAAGRAGTGGARMEMARREVRTAVSSMENAPLPAETGRSRGGDGAAALGD